MSIKSLLFIAAATASCLPAAASAQYAGFPPGYGQGRFGQGEVLECGSGRGRFSRCAVDTRGGVRILRQVSSDPCVEGRTWGAESGSIWVNRGCRAQFVVGGGVGRRSRYGGGYDNRYGQYGNGDVNGYYGNRDYGRDSRYYGGAGYGQGGGYYDNGDNGYARGGTFRCESTGGQQQFCQVDSRAGVRIVRQLSNSACVQGQSWGIARGGVWVSNGCRAEFAVGGY